ncbi:hypothetical protein AVEN_51874-1, partial [Araneus ventricosus]
MSILRDTNSKSTCAMTVAVIVKQQLSYHSVPSRGDFGREISRIATSRSSIGNLCAPLGRGGPM